MIRARYTICFCAAIALLVSCGCGGGGWHAPEAPERMTITVQAAGYERTDLPVEVTGDFSAPVRVVEIDRHGDVVDPATPFQVDAGRRLTLLLRGTTPADGYRAFQIYSGARETAAVNPLVTAEDGVMHEGQESIRVSTQAGGYFYHKKGAGFASLIDADGNDWIGYGQEKGSAGEFRGIPNMIHPEGGFHPGADTCASELVHQGPLRVTIRSECHGGAWRCSWDIFPRFARMTVEEAAHPYWFLYEGTPGGRLDMAGDYWVTADGTKQPASREWKGKLEQPRWVYFADGALDRVLFLAQHPEDGDFDQYWPMEENMTVFGFGRELRCCDKSLTAAPARFSVGLVESREHGEVARQVHSVYRDVFVAKGAVEQRN